MQNKSYSKHFFHWASDYVTLHFGDLDFTLSHQTIKHKFYKLQEGNMHLQMIQYQAQ